MRQGKVFTFPSSVSAQLECVRVWIQVRPFAMCVGRRCRRWGHHWVWRRYHNTFRYWHRGHGHGHGGQLQFLFLLLYCQWHCHLLLLARVHTVIGHCRGVYVRLFFQLCRCVASTLIFIFFFTRFLLFCLYCLYFSRFFFLFTFCASCCQLVANTIYQRVRPRWQRCTFNQSLLT